MQHTTIAVDVAKSIFEVAISHRPGKVSARQRLTRQRFARFLAEQPPAMVVMESCGMAHYWGRVAQARGHTVRLLPPRDVRPYVRGNKTDRSDTTGILEANRNEAIRPVPVKSVEQHALTGLHRMRATWVATRTVRLNTLRGLLRELGVTIPTGSRQVVPRVWQLVSDAESALPDALRPVLAEAAREVTELERRIGEVEAQLEGIARQNPLVRRLRTIPGVGLLTATAIVASIGSLTRFPLGAALRQCARLDAPRVLERERAPTRTDHETGRSVPANAADPRRPLGASSCQAQPETGSAARLGARARAGAGAQQGRRRRREQASPDRLGCDRPRRRLPWGDRNLIHPSETANPTS